MKTKNGLMTSEKKCTCSAIQQCELHRKPRVQPSHSGNDIKDSKDNVKKGGKK